MEDCNRFSIYEMIGKTVAFSRHGETISGNCQHVIRRPLENIILMVINEKEYVFLEPTKINETAGQISFLYGSQTGEEQDMFEFCGEDFNIEWGEDIRKSIGREKACFAIDFKIG